MSTELTREQVVDLLRYMGSDKIIDHPNKDNIQFNCTVHGENTPSAGFSMSKQIFNCFACHAGGTADWYLLKSLPEQFRNIYQAREFLEKRYGLSFEKEERKLKSKLLRFDELGEEGKEEHKDIPILPKSTIAPYRSGKETYSYFFERGFTKRTMKTFEVGRDLDAETVTVPIRNGEGELVGLVGRYIDPNRPHNQRYRVYNFPKGLITFPQDKLELEDNTVIMVEGLLDAVWMFQKGYYNTQAILGNRCTEPQFKYLYEAGAKNFILMFDNDKGGAKAIEFFENMTKDYDINIYYVTYPEGKSDPQELNEDEIEQMIQNKYSKLKRKLRRF